MKEIRNTRSGTSKAEKKKDNVPVYKKAVNEDIPKQRRRSTRQTEHIYDLDVSNEPALPFKKTRDGFKLKKTIVKRKVQKQNKRPYKKKNQEPEVIVATKPSPTQVLNIVENITPVHGDKSNSQPNVNLDNLRCDEVIGPSSEDDDNVEQINDVSHVEQELTDMPEISTPIVPRLNNKSIDIKRSLYKDFISPIVRSFTRASVNSPEKSPWRVSTLENNKIPAKFQSIKNSLLPSYDTSWKSPVQSSSPRISLTRPYPAAARLFEDSDLNLNEVSKQNKSTNSQQPSNNTDDSANSQTERQSFISQDYDNTPENRNTVFGFRSTNQEPSRVLRTHNEIIPKPTRASLREIKNVISNCKNMKNNPSDKENVMKQNKKIIHCTITSATQEMNVSKEVTENIMNLRKKTQKIIPCTVTSATQEMNVSKVVAENTMNDTDHTSNQSSNQSSSESSSQSSIRSSSCCKVLLFDEPEELQTTFKRDESFQCYKAKEQNPRQQAFERKLEKLDKPKRTKAKIKLTTEEWVAAKKWERSFNAMVEEVEGFEMIIDYK